MSESFAPILEALLALGAGESEYRLHTSTDLTQRPEDSNSSDNSKPQTNSVPNQVFNTYELAELIYSYLNPEHAALAIRINKTAQNIMLESQVIQQGHRIVRIMSTAHWVSHKPDPPTAGSVRVWLLCSAGHTFSIKLEPGSPEPKHKASWSKLAMPVAEHMLRLTADGRGNKRGAKMTFNGSNTLEDYVKWLYDYHFADQAGEGGGRGLVAVRTGIWERSSTDHIWPALDR